MHHIIGQVSESDDATIAYLADLGLTVLGRDARKRAESSPTAPLVSCRGIKARLPLAPEEFNAAMDRDLAALTEA